MKKAADKIVVGDEFYLFISNRARKVKVIKVHRVADTKLITFSYQINRRTETVCVSLRCLDRGLMYSSLNS